MAHQPGPKSEFTSPARNAFFTKLKPVCVELSKLALQGQQNPDRPKRAQDLLTQLNATLEAQVAYDAKVFDEKIADYIFFPLSQVLRAQEAYPARVIETVIKSLRLLVQHGWKAKISKELSQQLLILLTFMIGGVPGKEQTQPAKPEETIVEGYKALTALIKAAGVSAKDSPLTDEKIIPSLGHAISLILDGAAQGSTSDIQLAALNAITTVYVTIKQDDVLATFFPGAVSSLSRLLSPPLSNQAQRRVLVAGVNALRTILTAVLSDLKLRAVLKEVDQGATDVEEESLQEDGKGKILSPAWLKATASQVKLALSTVLKLRNHGGADVRKSIERLCIALLDECHTSLANSASILVESAMVVREDRDEASDGLVSAIGDDHSTFYGTSLQDLATIYPELLDTINTTVFNWVTSLPRAMQSSDERVKQGAIRNLIKGQELLSSLGVHSANLEDSLSSALRDSIVALVVNSKCPKVLNKVESDQNLWRSADLVQTGQGDQGYRPVILQQESQRDTRGEVITLIRHIGPPTQEARLAAEMLPYIREAAGVEQVSSFWLAFELVKASFAQTADVDEFLDLTDAAADPALQDRDSVFNELYSFAVSVLDAHSDDVDAVDWRLEAVALETIAFAAARLGQAFRPELIDVLYPISTFLGSGQPELRGHAIATLNSLTASCGYKTVSELIIDNVDYMVNSVSLRLNQFDISPASTKVLTMMIRLTGPKLLPFLDDVVAGIFAALDNYHGYTAFVESLFGVLAEVVEQGVKSDQLMIEDGKTKSVDHRKRRLESTGVDDALDFLDKRAKRRKEEEEEADVEEVIRGHPQEAWKTAEQEMDAIDARNRGEGEEDAPPPDEVALPKTPTYTLLTKITSLTEHYLTSPTPTLRKRLLDLLSQVAPALAPDENAFLPLLNDVWPVVVSRLHDSEPYVVVAACGTLSALCRSAGDFLTTRITTEWGDGLGKWCRRVRDEARRKRATAGPASRSTGASILSPAATGQVQGAAEILIPGRDVGPSSDNNNRSLQLTPASATSQSAMAASSSSTSVAGLGKYASAAQTWEAVVSMLVAIVSFVRVDDGMFEEILELLVADGVLERSVEARAALEAVNADAVWLALYERGRVEVVPTPVMEGVRFASMEGLGV